MGFFDKMKGVINAVDSAREALEKAATTAAPRAAKPAPKVEEVEEPNDAAADTDESAGEAPFDFEAEPEAWYFASRVIEQAWEDEPKRDALFEKYGIEGEAHFQHLREAWRRFQAQLAEDEGEQAVRELLQRCLNAETQMHREESRAELAAASPEMLEPIEGVSLQTYGRIVAAMTAGAELSALLQKHGMDQAKYDRVSAAWNQRMAEDTTFTISVEYGKAFTTSSNEERGTTAGPTHTWEQYIEATEAMSAGTAVGMDPQAVLKGLGMTLSEYVQAGTHWGEWFNTNAIRDPSLVTQHAELSDKYRAKYAAAKSDGDLEF